jgi:diacylglycerol kinase family enzyme
VGPRESRGGSLALVPCFLNLRSGSAAVARERLAATGLLDLHPVEPTEMVREVERVLAMGATRVAVAGGDGTLATVAAPVLRAGAELAVIPAGTLNHFAGHLGLAGDDMEAAARLAARGTRVVCADVGWLNGTQLILNTSSLGAYVNFVRTRERLERWLDYYTASLASGIHTFFGQRHFQLELHVDGEARRYETTMVFVSVGEREAVRGDGSPCPPAQRGLHVLVARADAPLHMVRFAAAAYRRGQLGEAREGAFDSFVTERCTVRGRRRRATVAVDGELVKVAGAVSYEIQHDALRVVAPESAG